MQKKLTRELCVYNLLYLFDGVKALIVVRVRVDASSDLLCSVVRIKRESLKVTAVEPNSDLREQTPFCQVDIILVVKCWM